MTVQELCESWKCRHLYSWTFLIWWRVLASLALNKLATAVVVPCRENANSTHSLYCCSVSTQSLYPSKCGCTYTHIGRKYDDLWTEHSGLHGCLRSIHPILFCCVNLRSNCSSLSILTLHEGPQYYSGRLSLVISQHNDHPLKHEGQVLCCRAHITFFYKDNNYKHTKISKKLTIS